MKTVSLDKTIRPKKDWTLRRHVQRIISDGEGPPVVSLGKRAVGIVDEDADAWIAARRKTPPGWDDKNSAA